MKNIRVAKASPTHEPVEDVSILIDYAVAIPEFVPYTLQDNYQERMKKFYMEQAELIVDGLTQALPRGTLERILYLLLVRQASIQRIALQL